MRAGLALFSFMLVIIGVLDMVHGGVFFGVVLGIMGLGFGILATAKNKEIK